MTLSSRAFAENVAWSAAAHVLGRGSLVLASVLLARRLDISDFATYSYFQLTVSMLASHAALGMGMTASRLFAEAAHVEGPPYPPLGALWLLSAIGSALFVVAVLMLPAPIIDGGLPIPRWLIALGVFTICIGIVPSGGVLGLERYVAATAVSAASSLILVAGSTISARAESSMMAMVFVVLASFSQSLGNTIVVLRRLGVRRIAISIRLGKLELQKIASMTGPLIGVSILAASGSWVVGRVILAGSSGEKGFALYSVGLQCYALALFLPSMVARVILPLVVKAKMKSLDRASQDAVRKGLVAALLSALVVTSLGVAASPWLLKLYGLDVPGYEWLLTAFFVAAVPLAPANTLGNSIIASNGEKAWLYVILGSFMVMLAVASVFRSLGPWGGALAHGCSSLFLTAAAIYTARRRKLI